MWFKYAAIIQAAFLVLVGIVVYFWNKKGKKQE